MKRRLPSALSLSKGRLAPRPSVPLPHWLGEALITCAQFLFEQGALEMLALQGRALLTTDVPLDLGPGRWLLVRFPSPAWETEPHLLVLLAPRDAPETPPETEHVPF